MFRACAEDLGWPRKSGFCSLCHGEAAAERRERVQLPPPAGSEHRQETPGGIFVGDLYKPVEKSERKGGRKGGREGEKEESREGAREEGAEAENFSESAKPVLVRENLALEVRNCNLAR